MQVVLITLAALAAVWLCFLAFLAIARPDTATIKSAMRLLPDTLRMIRRLATDTALPLSARLPVWLLVGYLAMPIDLVPDFIPVLGYADDLIVVAFVLRRLARKAGPAKIAEHWPGTAAGLQSVSRLLGLPTA